jgi:hypothetical protein
MTLLVRISELIQEVVVIGGVELILEVIARTTRRRWMG